ncbi:NHLP family bacteriocin export ABC transporter peptidase/permease/ATPase subunit [Marinibaculum pumilum]|uniref:NHLP family bacteriocin export ABC transporter peptidase/permease/ATPase subunit n=1 Tax=Marinibaculum pumilum TaxID=1766165 RepID=A0ABV7L8R6_9PROT
MRGAAPRWRRVRTPTVLQMEAVECGAACLAMVLAHHGRHLPLEELRYRCGVSRDGTKASALTAAAEHYGLRVKGFRKEPDGLMDLPLPQILFWNFNHFVVLDGLDARWAHINDPAAGPRRISRSEFDESFTGVTLAFEPMPAFAKGGQAPSPWRGLTRLLAGAKGAFLFVVVTGLALAIPGLLVPAFTRVYIDYLLIEGLSGWLYPLIGVMVATAALRALLTALRESHLLRLQTKVSLRSSCQFFWHVLTLPMRFFAQRQSGEIGTRLQYNERLALLVGGDLANGALQLMTMAIYAVVMLHYDVTLTLVGIGVAALNLAVFLVVSRRLADANQKLLMDRGRLTGVAMQGLAMIDSLKASGIDDQFFRRWAGQHAKVVSTEQRLQRVRHLLNAVPVFLGVAATALVLTVGGLSVMDGALTIGTLFAFQALLISFSAPIAGLVTLGAQTEEARGYLSRVDDVLSHPPDAEFATGTAPDLPSDGRPQAADGQPPVAARLTGRAELRGVTFGFIPTEPPLIRDLDLSVPAGARVALVGGSGSGKTTVGKLLAGLYHPWSGEVLLDGRDLRQIPRDLLRSSVAMVDQEIALFDGSVADNITLWDPTMPEARVVAAAKDAAIHDDVAGRPGAYAHRVGEGGRHFSGGQRQRIEIARALVGEPALLIFDEATSALDAATERTVIDNIRRRGCACLIIAHRLSTVRDCDEIIVLDHGRIVERGSHDALMAARGAYYRLVEA